MISKKNNHISKNMKDRIDYLTLRIEILTDHLDEYKNEMNPRTFEYISKDIETHKRELKIRQDFPITF
ncbi:MAG: hypothetical protein ACFFBP_05340 [Promethearchaeota archaeon]